MKKSRSDNATLLPDCRERVEVAGVLGMAWETEGSNTDNWQSIMELCILLEMATLALGLINAGHCCGGFAPWLFVGRCDCRPA